MATINEEAITKLNNEFKAAEKLSRRGAAVAEPVLDALVLFCNQSSVFAQAVVQTGKNLKDCIETTVDGAEGAISDIEVYRRAAAYYFDGAKVSFVMNIDLGADTPNAAPAPIPVPVPAPTPKKGLQISLDELL